jgi:D-sedoheptulose 7-phosphate isomerase
MKPQEYINEVKLVLDQLPIPALETVIDILHAARLTQNRVFIMGNGGSASTASHFACDLGKNTRRPDLFPFKVICLSDNVALFTALANDEGYDQVFVQQLQSLLQPGDVVIAISTSGNSSNVLQAVAFARANQAVTVGFTGFDGGKLAGMVDHQVHVPSNSIEQVEDVHLMLEHLICLNLRLRA